MLIKEFNKEQFNSYLNLLKNFGALSNLFSDSNTPFIHYRIAENIFCRSFPAENLSRSDTAFDAKLNNIGIGIKTFILKKDKSSEKIAEFNSLSQELRKLNGEDLAIRLGELRNERIDLAKRIYNLESGIYHCITRTTGKLVIFNTPYDSINLEKIKLIKSSSINSQNIQFTDGINVYSFNSSKSTLFKNFNIPHSAYELKISIHKDPFELISNLFERINFLPDNNLEIPGKNFVILPLFSLKGIKHVPEKSQLNQWRASGRTRNDGEVYIPIPRVIHKYYPKFFPNKNQQFNLHTPNNENLLAKICQQGSKALMTNPNKALSDWLLRTVLKLEPKEILTLEKLYEVGIDSVRITKVNNLNYEIDFAPVDSYEKFYETMVSNG